MVITNRVYIARVWTGDKIYTIYNGEILSVSKNPFKKKGVPYHILSDKNKRTKHKRLTEIIEVPLEQAR
jgi:hypothetical protein